ncbi:hypothetical protein OnM2_058023 [Erysiphe neolycopersici]|uniref:Retrovirus-related Pol polyprotein from transposon TNT 1-94-like beta-barrel domain-containing protein n=1 Tax=Erysiphe neolycopersici TaxID=212602 RepID=A0A420HQE6_9PEZI|nr:hypothetical protein OnM2_058023 [Erysiphe neolycopersici]
MCEGIGDVKIRWEDDERAARQLTIRDVLYIPHSGDNLLSSGILRSKGIDFYTMNDKLHLFKHNKSRILLMGVMTLAQIWKVQHTCTDFAFSLKKITKISLNLSKQEPLPARLGGIWAVNKPVE